jgi:nitrate reductase delta subunit
MKPTTSTTNYTAALDAIGRLLEGPYADAPALIATAKDALREPRWNATVAALDNFSARWFPLAMEAREELYTAVFDIMPACVPYVGIHLFGEENYRRGAFMAALSQRFEQARFNPGRELPDHIAVLLRFAAMAEEDERRDLAKYCLLAPLEQMIAALKPDIPFRFLLEAALRLLQAAYPGLEPAPTPLSQHQSATACTPVAGCGCGAVFSTVNAQEKHAQQGNLIYG